MSYDDLTYMCFCPEKRDELTLEIQTPSYSKTGVKINILSVVCFFNFQRDDAQICTVHYGQTLVCNRHRWPGISMYATSALRGQTSLRTFIFLIDSCCRNFLEIPTWIFSSSPRVATQPSVCLQKSSVSQTLVRSGGIRWRVVFRTHPVFFHQLCDIYFS